MWLADSLGDSLHIGHYVSFGSFKESVSWHTTSAALVVSQIIVVQDGNPANDQADLKLLSVVCDREDDEEDATDNATYDGYCPRGTLQTLQAQLEQLGVDFQVCLPDKTRLEALPKPDRRRIINQWFTYFNKHQFEFLESIRRKEVRDQKIMQMVRRSKIDIDPVCSLGNFDIDTIIEDEDAIDTSSAKDQEFNSRSPGQQEVRLAEQESLDDDQRSEKSSRHEEEVRSCIRI
ncbi:hypothetical protein N0V85_007014 [Neurospora sp. IMI 360204]|nr:hypothetical protein N0V85_007014 [Neurospora sp. IMI 360204]